MAGIFTREGLRFLYRRDEGTVDVRTWIAGTALLGVVLFVLSLAWVALRPWAGRGLDERAMLDPLTIVAYIYAIFFAFAVIVIAVSYVNLSAKRFRARGWSGSWPLGLSGLPLVALLLWGAAQWLNWRVPESVPGWSVLTLSLLCAALFVWHVIDLALRRD